MIAKRELDCIRRLFAFCVWFVRVGLIEGRQTEEPPQSIDWRTTVMIDDDIERCAGPSIMLTCDSPSFLGLFCPADQHQLAHVWFAIFM